MSQVRDTPRGFRNTQIAFPKKLCKEDSAQRHPFEIPELVETTLSFLSLGDQVGFSGVNHTFAACIKNTVGKSHFSSYLKPELAPQSTAEALTLFRNPENHKNIYLLNNWYQSISQSDFCLFLYYFLKYDGSFSQINYCKYYEQLKTQQMFLSPQEISQQEEECKDIEFNSRLDFVCENVQASRYQVTRILFTEFKDTVTSERIFTRIRPSDIFAHCVASNSPDWKLSFRIFNTLKITFPDFFSSLKTRLDHQGPHLLDELFQKIQSKFNYNIIIYQKKFMTVKNFSQRNFKNIHTNIILFQNLLNSLPLLSLAEKKVAFSVFFYRFFLFDFSPHSKKQKDHTPGSKIYVEHTLSDSSLLETNAILLDYFIRRVFELPLISQEPLVLSDLRTFISQHIIEFQKERSNLWAQWALRKNIHEMMENNDKISSILLRIRDFYTSGSGQNHPVLELQYAIENGSITQIEQLVSKYPNILNQQNALGFGPLETAVCSGNDQLVDYLLSLPSLHLAHDLSQSPYAYLQSPLLLMMRINNFKAFRTIIHRIGNQAAFYQLFVFGWEHEIKEKNTQPINNLFLCLRFLLDCVKTDPTPYLDLILFVCKDELAKMDRIHLPYYKSNLHARGSLLHIFPTGCETDSTQPDAKMAWQYAQVIHKFLDAGGNIRLFADILMDTSSLFNMWPSAQAHWNLTRNTSGIPPDGAYIFETNLLGFFAYFGHIDLLKRLLQQGLTRPTVEKESVSVNALACAIVGQQYDTVAFLLTNEDTPTPVIENIFQSNLQNNQEQEWLATPLHLAVQHNSLEIVALLLKHGANINAIDSDAQTPLMQARQAHGPESLMVKLLKDHHSYQPAFALEMHLDE